MNVLGHTVNNETAANISTTDQPQRASMPLNILLAEDNIVNQRVAVSILEKRGHVVQPVNNGKEALAALACEHFDLVLMDVQMPEMDGLEATAAIREMEQQSGRHIPIIAMTAHAMKGDRERCLDAGMDDYLAKPVDAKALMEVLQRWSPAASQRPTPSIRVNPTTTGFQETMAINLLLRAIDETVAARDRHFRYGRAACPSRRRPGAV